MIRFERGVTETKWYEISHPEALKTLNIGWGGIFCPHKNKKTIFFYKNINKPIETGKL